MSFTLPTTWNNQVIYTLPNYKLRTVNLTIGSTTSAATFPWTHQQQVYDWMCDWWEAEVSLPPLNTQQAGAWTAFLSSLRGQLGYFFLGHPLYATPFGSALGTPVVNGGPQYGRTLNTRGWTPNKTGLLLPGDHFQIGVRLHMVQNSVNSDGSGNASINIFPQIREAVGDGAPINLSNPQGLFRLNANTLKFSTSETKMWGVQFAAVEALP